MELGEMAGEFLKGLAERHPKNCGFHARYILRMKENYQSDDIHRAIEHALKYQAFEGKAIERIREEPCAKSTGRQRSNNINCFTSFPLP